MPQLLETVVEKCCAAGVNHPQRQQDAAKEGVPKEHREGDGQCEAGQQGQHRHPTTASKTPGKNRSRLSCTSKAGSPIRFSPMPMIRRANIFESVLVWARLDGW